MLDRQVRLFSDGEQGLARVALTGQARNEELDRVVQLLEGNGEDQRSP